MTDTEANGAVNSTGGRSTARLFNLSDGRSLPPFRDLGHCSASVKWADRHHSPGWHGSIRMHYSSGDRAVIAIHTDGDGYLNLMAPSRDSSICAKHECCYDDDCLDDSFDPIWRAWLEAVNSVLGCRVWDLTSFRDGIDISYSDTEYSGLSLCVDEIADAFNEAAAAVSAEDFSYLVEVATGRISPS